MLNDTSALETLISRADRPVIEQAGAICYRRSKKGKLEILLVASKKNGRWGIPKGHVDAGETVSATAIREAFEEAGVHGVLAPELFGAFNYEKDGSSNSYRVSVFLLEVTDIAKEYPEKATRVCRWVTHKTACRIASRPGLRLLLSRLSMSGRT